MVENLTLINTDGIPKKATGKWTKLAISTVCDCPKIKREREKEILFDRFGIGKNTQTLHAVGQKYSVTRERIRQIVNNGVKKIQKCGGDNDLKLNISVLEKIIEENGGLATKELVFKKLNIEDKIEQNAVTFIAALSNGLEQIKESNILKQGWNKKGIKFSKIKDTSEKATNFLKEHKKVASTKTISEEIKEDSDFCAAVLSCVKVIMKTDDGKWGLAFWPHVNPRSIRDKSKYIMIRHGQPLHYADLTLKISEMGIKNVTKQSVHNELIKNTDFVLVGRGIYALTEWGYEPGVVEDVIVTILSEAGKPLHKDDIIDKVLARRLVKASTVILNLQKPRFKRVGKAVYTIN